ncbi:MAG: hypothetical protein R3E73_03925 [Porticoccaceae bacterium]|nr:hypothetical protein [Pseudomonadales bacterium]MCP5172664.1 hypothetical protein [Pseudomonadales bacterium]MCP5302138.1 hypothetical protein [Pseudomonadales bacterium]
MKKNVIILTHGWTGSSVFSALIGKAGYWKGDNTHKKPDYDTHENKELIQLNERLMSELGFTGDHEHEFDLATIQNLAKRAENIDLSPYQEFVDKCEQNKPWIWKDPRLTWTIRVWAKLLDLKNIAFVILTRDDEQAWISCNLRRHIQSKRFTKAYNHGITSSLQKFLDENQCGFVKYEFEDLLLTPDKTIEELNGFLDINLTMEDLTSVYRYPLYKKSRNWKDKLEATAIYLKNYKERYR